MGPPDQSNEVRMRGRTARQPGAVARRFVDALDSVSGAVDRLLAAFLEERLRELVEIDPAMEPVGREIAGLVEAGGKRLRPAFVYWGHRATGADHDPGVFGPAAAVELLHTFALIHDDIMDRSPERRGRPAVHEGLAAVHDDEGLAGDRSWFGLGSGILAGDLTFVWADRMLDEAALAPDAIDRARSVFTELRVEVMAGQYLDLRLAGQREAVEDDSRKVALLKSGRYTVTRPLQLGAAIGGSDRLLDAALAAYGDAVGLAFQLRDDVLGLFGDRSATGKGAVEDLREGKRTVLMLRAMELAGEAERRVLASCLGDPELDEHAADRARQIVVDTGALEAIEQLLESQQAVAERALAPVEEPARAALVELAELAVSRID